ncbi:SfnB family sulfur acquisition oxidoreductase [Streptosporangium sp. NPDC020145]|uniref:SfnB family sulfur acquisition oxidoreductase n=1 Tax=Streptosporangium sp. NPDC020145 TaxID=3154694 RepID=UPI003434BF79
MTAHVTAHVIADDAEALETAGRLAAEFRAGASERDSARKLPHAEVERLSASGLLGVTVPADHGGADIRHETLAEVFRLLASGDPSLAQIPQSHFVYVNVLRRQGTPAQREFFFAEVLAGRRFGNAQSEAGTRHVQDIRTRLVPAPDGSFLLSGVKHYSTGALFAHWIPVLARAEDDTLHVAYVPREARGLTVVDDWDGMGQRTTASGTVKLDRVEVPADRVVPHHLTFQGPQLHGAVAQLLHTAIDVGIAAAALAEAAEFVRTRSRPWFESGHESAADDPLLIQRFGELGVQLRAAEALLATAARTVDAAGTPGAGLTEESAAEASIAVAAAKAFAASAAVDIGGALFELAGTRSALDGLNLHRFWRDARTHTLHDPARWKVQHIGRYLLNGTLPPRHGLL